MALTYREAVKSDADLLMDIYNSSFYDDYVRYGECPGYLSFFWFYQESYLLLC